MIFLPKILSRLQRHLYILSITCDILFPLLHHLRLQKQLVLEVVVDMLLDYDVFGVMLPATSEVSLVGRVEEV